MHAVCACGLLASGQVLVTMVGRAVRVGRSTIAAVTRAAEPEGASDGANNWRAEAELLQARAALARAQAELAEMKAQASRAEATDAEKAQPVVSKLALEGFLDNVQSKRDTTASLADFKFLETASSPQVSRPAGLLKSAAASELFSILAHLDAIETFGENQTVLAFMMQASIANLLGWIDVSGVGSGAAASPGDAAIGPPGSAMAQDVAALRRGLQPEVVLAALVKLDRDGEEQQRDWRPLARVFARARQLADIAEKVVPWNKIYPEALEQTAGMRIDEVRRAVLSFLREAERAEPGSWSDAEVEEAQRLLAQDGRSRAIFSRAEYVASNMNKSVEGAAALAPFLLIGLLGLVYYCIFESGPPTDGSLPAFDGGLPLYGLKEGAQGITPAAAGELPLYGLKR